MEVKNISFFYKDNIILDDISFKIKKGQITTIIGPNGSGKSTLFNIITKNLKAQKGQIIIDNKNINTIKLKEFAKKVAIVHQRNSIPENLKVYELVEYGRLPHKRFYEKFSQEDKKIVEEVMYKTRIYDLRNEYLKNLSGGQCQRAFLAMGLSQKTEILLLDEPTTYLDIQYQIEILDLVKELNNKENITILMVLHDINQAIKYSNEIIILKNSKIFASGKTTDVINKQSIKEIFSVDSEVLEFSGKKVVIF